MKEPGTEFLIELAAALRDSEHGKVAEHFAAGFLWALYPEWFDKHFKKQPSVATVLEREYRSTFGDKETSDE